MNQKEINERYNKIAWRYDLCQLIASPIILWARKALVREAMGSVLEIAIGTGANLSYYPKNSRITAIDTSEKMIEVAKNKARKFGLSVDFKIMDAKNLDFPGSSFDVVVSTLSLCTIPDPVRVLKEMSRVCRPDGQMLFLEHGRSSVEWISRWQDYRAEKCVEKYGCHPNRGPLEIIKKAGLKIISHKRFFFGIFTMIIASPRA